MLSLDVIIKKEHWPEDHACFWLHAGTIGDSNGEKRRLSAVTCSSKSYQAEALRCVHGLDSICLRKLTVTQHLHNLR